MCFLRVSFQRTDAQNKADEHDRLKEATKYSHFIRCRIAAGKTTTSCLQWTVTQHNVWLANTGIL